MSGTDLPTEGQTPSIIPDQAAVEAMFSELHAGRRPEISSPTHALQRSTHERAIFLAALRDLQIRGENCWEVNVPIEGAVTPAILISSEGDGRLNQLAKIAWNEGGRALLVVDPQRLLFTERGEEEGLCKVSLEPHPIVSLGRAEAFTEFAHGREILIHAGLALNAPGTVQPSAFRAEDVLRLLNARGALLTKEAAFNDPRFTVHPEEFRDAIAVQQPRWGRTQFEAAFKLDLSVGEFRAYVFKDVGTGGFTMALVHGDIEKAGELKMRMHSSCVTSETECAVDCDCRPQLQGALSKIAQSEAGILFYLVQEGRGAGLIPKAQDRAIEQSCNHQYGDHGGPYAAQGLPVDHRSYAQVGDILQMFGIRPDAETQRSIILLTNNSTKTAALTGLGYSEIRTEGIEYQPNPFNRAYLAKKGDAGNHRLVHPDLQALGDAATPEPPIPFMGMRLADAPRFTATASYRLPVQPHPDQVVMSADEFTALSSRYSDVISRLNLVDDVRTLPGDRKLLVVNQSNLGAYKAGHDVSPGDPLLLALSAPIWVKKHVYSDVVTNGTFIVLEYGKPQDTPPMVRVHFDSLLGRIPYMDEAHDRNRVAFRASLDKIVEHGHGFIAIMPDDGTGGGLGPQAVDQMYRQLGISGSKAESYEMLGIRPNVEALRAGFALIKHHVPDGKVDLLFHSQTRLNERPWFQEELWKAGIQPETFTFIFGQLDASV